ncbi:sulfatase [Spirosoma montaniterrae]|uniref:Sulfatase n=1 Tax=Spirosoma montaniterrae TaxID=1178516 RepID=A0A1P9WTX3_9BACT|nr:sulfatase [Spirosoma montaniterrae]AQG78824.1 sulfatase [Spirosoma montaniterrae]
MKHALAFLLFWMSSPLLAQTQPPNIVLIVADDLGYTDLSCYGHQRHRTPHIDSLARRGIRFTQAYAASPVCSPSRAALMTGKHPARLQLTNFLVGTRTDSLSPVDPAPWRPYLPASEITLAERLRTLGYQTGIVGKWHLGGVDSLAPWGQGFAFTRMIGRNGLDYYNYGIYEDSYKKEFRDKGQTYLTDKLTDYAVEFIGQADQKKPFFLYVPYSAPHILITPRADKLNKYLFNYNKWGEDYNPYYAAMLESLDDGVGRIVARLSELGLTENTLVIFTSDNGGVGLPELGPTPTNLAPLRKWKGHVYEGGIKVPLIMSWPGKMPQNQTCTNYLINTDFTPTLLELLGQPTPNLPDAKSFWPLLTNPATSLDRGAIFWHYPHFSNQMGRPAGAVRLGDWKLVENYETGQRELFNLARDIGETRDLSRSNRTKANELSTLLTNWRQEVGASMPVRKKPKS